MDEKKKKSPPKKKPEEKKEKLKFFSLNKILDKDCLYNLIIGERSNGKTYAVMHHMLERYCLYGEQSALIRRMDMDFKGKRGDMMFQNLVDNGAVTALTNGRWSGIYYRAMRWWLCKDDPENEGKKIIDDKPFCFGFSLTAMEHDKSSGGTQNIKTILYDEFLSRSYLPDEVMLFMQTLSSIIRHRSDVRIYMCGNTINPYSPFYKEMGLTNIAKMKKGDIDVYTYGNSKLRVAVQWADSPAKNKPSDVYFAFDSPRLNMITGKGDAWELDIYPHLPEKYVPFDVIFNFFIEFNGDIYHAECIRKEATGVQFIYIHQKTTPIKDVNKELIYSLKFNPKPNYRRRINRPKTPIERYINDRFHMEQVYYQDNMVGMAIENFIRAGNNGEKDI